MTLWYRNIITCTVCKGAVTGALSFFQDLKYQKAVQGALGLYCMFIEQKSQDTCSKIISGYGTDFRNNAFLGGVLSDSFICGNALPFCDAVAT